MTYYHDPDDTPHYSEMDWFKTYCDDIRRLFAKHEYVTVPMVHRSLGRSRERYTLGALTHIGVIETGIINPVRYVLAPKPTPRRQHFNGEMRGDRV